MKVSEAVAEKCLYFYKFCKIHWEILEPDVSQWILRNLYNTFFIEHCR